MIILKSNFEEEIRSDYSIYELQIIFINKYWKLYVFTNAL